MPIYKVIFACDTIFSIELTKQTLPENHPNNVDYRHDPKRSALISAIIESDTMEEATAEAQKLISIFLEKK